MSSIFPSFPVQKEATDKAYTLPVCKNIAIDFTTGEPIIENGNFVIVTEDEAVCVWCYFALRTAKGRFLAYGKNYGNEIEDRLVGRNYNSNDTNKIDRLIKNCLFQSKYIKSVDNINYSFESDTLSAEITITTVYSNNVTVNL